MITELDLIRADSDELGAEYADYLHPDAWTERQEDWEFWQEVRECCGGTDWSCAHYGQYPALLEDTY